MKSDGEAVSPTEAIPFGAVVTQTEDTPEAVAGGTWGEGTFDHTTFTIGGGDTAAVILTNPITAIPPTTPPTTPPTSPTTTPTPPAPSNPSTSTATPTAPSTTSQGAMVHTGGSMPGRAAFKLGVLITVLGLAGLTVLAIRRHRSHDRDGDAIQLDPADTSTVRILQRTEAEGALQAVVPTASRALFARVDAPNAWERNEADQKRNHLRRCDAPHCADVGVLRSQRASRRRRNREVVVHSSEWRV